MEYEFTDIDKIIYNIDSGYDILKAQSRAIKRKTVSRSLSPVSEAVPKVSKYFVTINPIDGIDTKEFVTKISSIVQWKWVDKYYYVFEQRSEELNVFKGLHAHMYLSGDINKARVHKTISDSVKRFIGNPLHVNVKQLKTDTDVDNVINYMNGSKEDSKKNKCINDIQFRISNSLESKYTNM